MSSGSSDNESSFNSKEGFHDYDGSPVERKPRIPPVTPKLPLSETSPGVDEEALQQENNELKQSLVIAGIRSKAVEKDSELSNEERNLLSRAYKNTVDALRSKLRSMTTLSNRKQETDESKMKCELEKNELRDFCLNVLSLLDKYLIPKAANPESKVFYLKMKGDYYRYLSEVASTEEKNPVPYAAVVCESQTAYQEAFDVAKENIDPSHPIRLGLALHFSVFYAKILNATDKARKLAIEAIDGAIEKPYKMDENSELIVQKLREKVTLWKSDTAGEEGEGGGEPGEATGGP